MLHPHFHVLVPDGVFSGGALSFAALPPPDDEEVERLLRKVARRVWKVARARYPDGLPYAEDAKAALAAASAQTRLPLSEEAARRARRCAFLEGFSLHANTHCHENDRASLERLCRYGARGPLALERLSRREDGKLEYRLKKPLPGGATTLVLTPRQLLERLCAVMVKPRIHLTRFFESPCAQLQSACPGGGPAAGRAASARCSHGDCDGVRVRRESQRSSPSPTGLGSPPAKDFRLRRLRLPLRRETTRARPHHLAGRRPTDSRAAHRDSTRAHPSADGAAAARAPLTFGARAVPPWQQRRRRPRQWCARGSLLRSLRALPATHWGLFRPPPAPQVLLPSGRKPALNRLSVR